jgi:hypothetical protein
MKLLLSLTVFVLGANAAYAIDCSVNELRKMPLKIPLPGKLELCMINPQNKHLPKCLSQSELNYAKEDILSQTPSTCGFKGSEFQLETDSLSGTVISCDDNEGTSAQKYVSMCMNAKSQDSKYMLKVCTDLQMVITMAFPLKPKDEKNGFMMVNTLGSNHVSHVNEISCGEGRAQSRLKSSPVPRDPKSGVEL